MRSPCEYYLRYLVLCRFSDERVNALMEQLGYPRLRSTYLQRIRRGTRPRKPFRPNTNHEKTNTWLVTRQLLPLFERDKYVDDATAILTNYDIRDILEMMILADAETDSLVQMVKERTGRILSEQTVRYYRHFFWNRDLLNAKEWSDFLDSYDKGQQLKGVYEETVELASWRLGFAVKGLDANNMLRQMQTEAFFRFMQTHNMSNDTKAAKIAATWAGVMFEANKLLNSGDTQLTEVINYFQTVFMEKSPEEIPAIDIVTGGLHSGRNMKGLPLPVEDFAEELRLEKEILQEES